MPVDAQSSTRDAKVGTTVRYGLDRMELRLDRVARVAHLDGRPDVASLDAGDGSTGYLLATFTLRNPNDRVEDLPLLQTELVTADGRTIDPAVYGPYVGDGPTDAPPTLAPKKSVRLTLVILDLPVATRAAELIFSPNDATPQYRYRLGAADVTTLPDVPRAAAR
jgi:hypothetical protein